MIESITVQSYRRRTPNTHRHTTSHHSNPPLNTGRVHLPTHGFGLTTRVKSKKRIEVALAL